MRLLASLLLITLASLAQAQTPVTDAYRADMKELLQVSGSVKLGEQVANAVSQQMINVLRAQQPGAPEKMFDIVKEVTSKFMSDFMNSQETADGITQAYAKFFTQDDIKQLIAFYKSPVGAKFVTNQGSLTAETQTLLQSRLPALIPKLQDELLKRFAAEGLPPPK